MIKHKIILIFLSIFCMITLNSCGGGSQAEAPNPEGDPVFEENSETSIQ